jgi:DNA-binding NtrC family response regulator
MSTKSGGFMPQTVVLAIGVDSALLANQCSAWQSAGYFVTFAESIREAIVHFRDGDYDLVLLGPSIPADSRERLTFLVRAGGSRIPVVCIADSSSACDSFADATFRNEPDELLRGIGEVLAKRAKAPAASQAMPRIAA